MHWRDVWTWGGWIFAALGTTLGLIYYGPQKMLQTWDWYMEKLFDHKVEDYLLSQVKFGMPIGGTRSKTSVPIPVHTIAEAIGWSQKKTIASLKRLHRRRKVTESNQHWEAKD